MKNKDLRDYAFSQNVKLWEIAEKIGITDSTFSRKLRRELDDSRKAELKNIIDQISAEKQ